MEVKNLLPIGSVVVLKDGEQKLMIYDIAQTDGNQGLFRNPKHFEIMFLYLIHKAIWDLDQCFCSIMMILKRFFLEDMKMKKEKTFWKKSKK